MNKFIKGLIIVLLGILTMSIASCGGNGKDFKLNITGDNGYSVSRVDVGSYILKKDGTDLCYFTVMTSAGLTTHDDNSETFITSKNKFSVSMRAYIPYCEVEDLSVTINGTKMEFGKFVYSGDKDDYFNSNGIPMVTSETDVKYLEDINIVVGGLDTSRLRMVKVSIWQSEMLNLEGEPKYTVAIKVGDSYLDIFNPLGLSQNATQVNNWFNTTGTYENITYDYSPFYSYSFLCPAGTQVIVYNITGLNFHFDSGFRSDSDFYQSLASESMQNKLGAITIIQDDTYNGCFVYKAIGNVFYDTFFW